MTAGTQRKVQRVVHLAGAALLLVYVYAPLEAQLQDVVRFVVFPVLVLTGIAMWQAPRIRRALKELRAGGARSMPAQR
jgi:thiosulfate reductase cytochrome b subunit